MPRPRTPDDGKSYISGLPSLLPNEKAFILGPLDIPNSLKFTVARLPGDTAIGHVRYSTAGGSMLCNAQPIVASTSKGLIAVAHNGNLINGAELRHELGQEGAIFNTMSDTEVMVHLIARSRERDLERALIDALSRVKGAYSIALLAPPMLGRPA